MTTRNRQEGFAQLPREVLWHADLTPTAKLVYVGLAAYADREGKAWPSHSRLSKDLGFAPSTVRRALNELRDAGYVEWTHQHEGNAQQSNLVTLHRTPADDRRPPRRQSATPPPTVSGPPAHSERTPPPTVSDELEPIEREPKNENQRTTRARDEDRFEEFWNTYPKKVGKRAARTAWGKATTRADPETIIAGARAYAAQVANKDPKYTKHPQGWLNDDRWDDAPTPAAPALNDTNRALIERMQQHQTKEQAHGTVGDHPHPGLLGQRQLAPA